MRIMDYENIEIKNQCISLHNLSVSVERLKQMNKKGSLVRRLLKNKTEDEKKLDLFLDTVPICTNYMISESLKLFGIDKKLYRLMTRQIEAWDSISYQIETRNLTDECLIGLSEGQYQMYLDLCNLIE
jgi:hypothetical protein